MFVEDCSLFTKKEQHQFVWIPNTTELLVSFDDRGIYVIAHLEFELAYYDSAVHRFNHYTTRTPPFPFSMNVFIKPLYTSQPYFYSRIYITTMISSFMMDFKKSVSFSKFWSKLNIIIIRHTFCNGIRNHETCMFPEHIFSKFLYFL